MNDTLEIPRTSPTRYLSGIVALNILSERGTGDWHPDVFRRRRTRTPRSFVIERGQEADPSAILGEEGLYDAGPVLDAMHVPHPEGPVWAATHARAIADLVLGSILRDESPHHVALDDWMPRDGDKQEVLDLLERAVSQLDRQEVEALKKWVSESLGREDAHHGLRR